jgi:hypothetical protein
MKPVIEIVKIVGIYLFKNSFWIIPAVKDLYITVKEYIIKKKKENGKPEESSIEDHTDLNGCGQGT